MHLKIYFKKYVKKNNYCVAWEGSINKLNRTLCVLKYILRTMLKKSNYCVAWEGSINKLSRVVLERYARKLLAWKET